LRRGEGNRGIQVKGRREESGMRKKWGDKVLYVFKGKRKGVSGKSWGS